MARVNFHLYFLCLVILDISQADKVGIYWGAEIDEGSLSEACETGKYSYVNIYYLDKIENVQAAQLTLQNHCNPYLDECSILRSDIIFCQKQGIKVMLSVLLKANLTSQDTRVASDYLWNNFFGGNSTSRPFGDAILDGIDFFIYGYSIYLENLAASFKLYNSTHNIHLSATLMCDTEKFGISTLNSGLLDYISVMFVGSYSCVYDIHNGNLDYLVGSWNQWNMLKVRKIFLGLLPSPSSSTGYIPADVLHYRILPIMRKSPKYGGVMLPSRHGDKLSGYSDSFISPLCIPQNPPQCSSHDGINFTESFGYMSMASFRVNESELISQNCCEVICRNNCSCNAYAPTNSITNTGCQIWSKSSTFHKSSGSNGHKIYVSKGEEQSSKLHIVAVIWIIIGVVGASLAIPFMCFLSCAFCRKYTTKVDRINRQRKLIHDIGGTAMVSMSDDIVIFSFDVMVGATNNFDASSKLGEGGFGPVYMGRLTNQQEIAIKRLSRSSGQGLTEFKNEAMLIAKLQHTNLVRLLGLCIEREERMLVYEYMPNKSLDFHLFDVERRKLLDWEKRMNIIEGIAQGVLYLHKYSRLKVIHRDLKASNILLDDEMRPKISDFGMARILGLHGIEEQTSRIVGTYGYMSPEYVLTGVVSTKVDVFSFGVLLVEILSGKKNNCSYDSDSPLNLIGYAWKLWNEGRALEVVDQGLNETSNPNEVLRCMQIGLLCVQYSATDRPTMFDVVTFLSNDAVQLAQPKQPAFFFTVDMTNGELLGNIQRRDSINNVTVSDMDGR